MDHDNDIDMPGTPSDVPRLPSSPSEPLPRHSDHDEALLLRAIVDAIPEAILVHAPDGTITFYSEGARRMLGYSTDQMAELEPYGWIAPDMKSGSAGRLERILYDGTHTFESAMRRADGSTIPTEVMSRRVDSPGGPQVITVIRDITRRRAAEAQLVHLAYHDSLTGLANRAQFEDRLQDAIAGARRFGDLLAVGYVDLDRFKPINDTYGHAAGDAALRIIAERLAACVREQDTVARIGGDEFVLVLPRLSAVSELDAVADRLLSHICLPMDIADIMVRLTASIGFAVFDTESDDAYSIVMKSDVAMYTAKNDPGNPWRLWAPEMGVSVIDTQRPSSVRELLESD